MNNVGDIKTFTITGTQTEGIRYVWKWWDNSVDTTLVPTVTKAVNMGGNPLSGYALPYSVETVDVFGQSAVYSDSVAVNNPPQVVAGLTLTSANGQLVEYSTVVQAVVYDLENDSMSFAWSQDDLVVGIGNRSYYGQVPAYYNGTYVGTRSGTLAWFDHLVTASTTLKLTATDANGGVLNVEFPLYGFQKADVYFAPTVGPQSQTGDASSEPIVTAGENAQFTIYSSDANRTVFVWGFWGTNGWTFPSSTNGTTDILPDGTKRNVVVRATAGETPGNKLAEVTAYNLDNNTFTIVTVPVVVVSNDPPVALSYEMTPTVPSAGDVIRFRASYSDPNLDLVLTKWVFTNPSITLWGRTVYLNTAYHGMTAGQEVVGKFQVFDRLGDYDEMSFSFILA